MPLAYNLGMYAIVPPKGRDHHLPHLSSGCLAAYHILNDIRHAGGYVSFAC